MPRLTVFVVCFLLIACAAQPASPTPTPTTSPTQAPTPAASADVATRLAAILEMQRKRDGAPGMLALIRQAGVETFAAAGSADLAGSPIDATARFRVGSVTKPIVGALVLLAVRDGLFALSDNVEDLVPGVLRAQPAVTVEQLLAHTSGVFNEGDEGDLMGDVDLIADPTIRADAQALLADYQAGKPVAVTDRIWIALAETHDRYNAPGAGYHYSNVNYQVLAMILEQATGQSLAEFFRKKIVEPLGLTRTSLAPADRTTPEIRGYLKGAAGLQDVSDDLAWFGNGGNGGVLSTAGELLGLMRAIVSGDLLGAELTADMKNVRLAGYGLGLATYDLSCGTFYGHGGSVLGTQSIALVADETDDGVVIALNVKSDDDPRLPSVADTLVCRAP